MTTNYWLYGYYNDGQSIASIDIVKKYFPQTVLCDDFDQMLANLEENGQHVVFLIEPNFGLRQGVWIHQVQTLVSRSVQCVWVVNEIFTLNNPVIYNSPSKIMVWASTVPNLLIVAPGQHNFGTHHYPWVIWQNWLQDAVDVYKHPTMQNYIEPLDPAESKPLLFDALLGGPRPYRTLLHDWIEEDPVLSAQTILAYYGGKTTRPKLIYEPDMVLLDPIDHCGVVCQFQDIRVRFGLIPPMSVYKQTAYSMVTETSGQHDYVFFTEKIARVIFCRRLFIALSSYGYLTRLRESGFKTFGNVINESYDLEVDDKRRWRMAFEQMQQLAAMDQSWVLEQIQPIVEHNLQVLMTTDWHKKMSNDVNQILAARLNLKKS
jgi:hypothetical protein